MPREGRRTHSPRPRAEFARRDACHGWRCANSTRATTAWPHPRTASRRLIRDSMGETAADEIFVTVITCGCFVAVCRRQRVQWPPFGSIAFSIFSAPVRARGAQPNAPLPAGRVPDVTFSSRRGVLSLVSRDEPLRRRLGQHPPAPSSRPRRSSSRPQEHKTTHMHHATYSRISHYHARRARASGSPRSGASSRTGKHTRWGS